MGEYGFLLTRMVPCKERIYDSAFIYTGEYGSVKARILAYFMPCFFSKCEQIFEEILNEKLYFLCHTSTMKSSQ